MCTAELPLVALMCIVGLTLVSQHVLQHLPWWRYVYYRTSPGGATCIAVPPLLVLYVHHSASLGGAACIAAPPMLAVLVMQRLAYWCYFFYQSTTPSLSG